MPIINPNSAPVQLNLLYLSTTQQRPKAGVGIYLSGSLTSVSPWTADTAVVAGESFAVENNVFTATTGGKTAKTGTGPTGTGTGINDGAVVWSFTPTPYIQPSRIEHIRAGIAQ